jgi:NADH-quinone oxidoreductase subunit A
MVESYQRNRHPGGRATADFVTNPPNAERGSESGFGRSPAEAERAHLCAIVAAVCPFERRSRLRVLGDWAAILLFVLFAGAIASSLLLASIFVGRRGKRVGRAKTMPFESGVAVAAYQPSRFSISYYLTAMMFIVFDIEMVFLAPLAVLMRRLQLFGLAELVLFVVLLGVGYVYIWRKGALEWK